MKPTESATVSSLLVAAEKKRVFHTLDGLRGVAAVAVVFVHYATPGSPLNAGRGTLAVDLFFMISGVVLGCAYADRLDHALTLRRFLVTRIVRLYPLYLLGTSVGIAFLALALLTGHFALWSGSQFVLAALPALLMLPSPPLHGMGDSLYPFNFVAWSLLAEILVNIVFARSRWTRTASGALSLALCGAVAAIMIAILWTGRVDGGWIWQDMVLGLLRIVFPFFTGVWMWRLYAARRWRAPNVPPGLLLILLAALLWSHPGVAWGLGYDLAVLFVAFPILVWLAMHSEPRRGVGLLTVLGVISYPLYVIHIPARFFIPRLSDALFGQSGPKYAMWTAGTTVIALIALSWVLAQTYDVWARKWLARFLEQAPRPGT